MYRIETMGRDECERSLHHSPPGAWTFATEAEARAAMMRLAGRPLDAWIVGPSGDICAQDCMGIRPTDGTPLADFARAARDEESRREAADRDLRWSEGRGAQRRKMLNENPNVPYLPGGAKVDP